MRPLLLRLGLLQLFGAAVFVMHSTVEAIPRGASGSMIQDNNIIIVTGGAGYVGSHVVVKLCESGYKPVIIDNFYNSIPSVTGKLEILTGSSIEVAALDIRDVAGLAALFTKIQPSAVIHCAGLKAVGESFDHPLMYYEQNIGGTLNLLNQMDAVGCRRIVFSSSATVYGEAAKVPFRETSYTGPTNPYGRTKLFIEEIIRDWSVAGDDRSAALLRYFNPIGADAAGLIGENSKGIPNNLMPLMMDVAIGKRDELSVFGNDYDTSDGTAVRDYIHVDDLARGHIAALDFMNGVTGAEVFNLGTGSGVSVFELIAAFERVTGQTIAHRIARRRLGDVAVSLADPLRAKEVLGWETRLDLDRMCADSWRFCSHNNASSDD